MLYSTNGNGHGVATAGFPTTPNAQRQLYPVADPSQGTTQQAYGPGQPAFVPQPAPQQVAPQQPATYVVSPSTPLPAPQTPAPQQSSGAATITEIEAACPGAPADFVLGQVKAQATVQSAQTAFIGLMGQRVQQLESSRVMQQAAAPLQPQQFAQAPSPVQGAQAPMAQHAQPQFVQGIPAQHQPPMPGNMPVDAGTAPAQQFGNPADLWKSKIEDRERLLISAGYNAHAARQKAVFDTDAENPGLREAYMSTQNHIPVRPVNPQAQYAG